METPSLEIGEVVGSDDEGERMLRLAGPEGIQRPDGILRRGHLQFDVQELDLEVRIAADGLDGSVETVLTGWQTMGLFEGILRGHHEIHEVESRFLCQEANNGQVPLVQRIKAAGIDGDVH